MREKLSELINVKTIVTFAVMLVFVVLALTNVVEADDVMAIVIMVVSFYFGTQHEKGK